VQEPGEQGIRKVKIVLIGGSGQRREQYEAVTDEAGQFNVQDVEPGTYLAQLQRSGYATSGKAPRAGIKVIGGQDTKDLVFHMLEAGVITGKIIDLDGDPLRSGISVAATASSGRATTRNPVTWERSQ
jgi:hypothetical protein